MRFFVAGIATETNTFAPWPTGRAAFEGHVHFRGDSSGQTPPALVAAAFRERARRGGHEYVEGLITSAAPSGPVIHAVYTRFRDDVIADMLTKGPFDIVLLILHGAMVSTECDDCEGDLLQAIRRAAPSAVIGALLDPHCHLTSEMLSAATALVLMKEYPHVDFVERARELFGICEGAAAGRISPVSAVFDCRMVGFFPTTSEPMAGLLRLMREIEGRPGVLSASFAHGFPWGDTPDTGARVLVIADGDRQLANRTATELGMRVYGRRRELLPHLPDMDEALELAKGCSGCVVLADVADNAGGGAPSDNVALLEKLIASRIRPAALGLVWDPIAAAICADAGVGASFSLRLGGKSGEASGDPLDAVVTVRAIAPRHEQSGLGSSKVALGLSVWVEISGVAVVIVSNRVQTFAPDAFAALGIDLSAMRVIAVKSSQHFHARFSPLAQRVIRVATPGAIQMSFAAIPYRKKRDVNYHPRIEDPLGLDGKA